jgi:hypothetical protein
MSSADHFEFEYNSIKVPYPSSDQLKGWIASIHRFHQPPNDIQVAQHVSRLTVQLATPLIADQELQFCCEEIENLEGVSVAENLHAYRRPTVRNHADSALAVLAGLDANEDQKLVISRAIHALRQAAETRQRVPSCTFNESRVNFGCPPLGSTPF